MPFFHRTGLPASRRGLGTLPAALRMNPHLRHRRPSGLARSGHILRFQFPWIFPHRGRRSVFSSSSALRSFRLSAALFTTTASADFSGTLAPETSPGKVREHSASAARLYPMWLSVTVGFRASQHAHRPYRASLPVRVPAVVPLLRTSFISYPRGSGLVFRYGCRHSFRSSPFI